MQHKLIQMKIIDIFSDNSAYCIFCKRRMNRRLFVYEENKTGVCSECSRILTLFPTGIFRTAGEQLTVTAPFDYSGILRRAFLDYKFNGCRSFAPVFCYYMNGLLEYMDSECDNELIADIDFVTAVPFSLRRPKERSYDQSALLAQGIASHFNLPYSDKTLFRKRDTRRQSSLDSVQRAKNVKDTFGAFPEAAAGKHILLIDDICTTGATVREAADTLTKSGARAVTALVLAIENRQKHSPELSYLLR